MVRRGRGHAQCFFGERDRLAFLEWLGKYAARFECAIHAYVLMGNHVHLLLTASAGGGTARLMKKLCERHTRSISETQEGPGALWEEDFEASPIVRAQLVTRPGAYRWSSHAANALGRENALITPHPFYYALGRNDQERQGAYLRLFAAKAIPRGQTPGGPRPGPRGPSRPT